MTDPDSTWYVRSRGRVLGPFGFGQLEALRNQGRISKFDEVSQDRRMWGRADSMPELYPDSAPEPPLESAGSAGPNTRTESAEEGYRINDGGGAPGPVTDEVSSWYYMGRQGQTGPIKLTELVRLAQSGMVGPETLIWTAALGDWVPARTVTALGLAHPEERAATVKPVNMDDDPSTIAPRGVGISVASFVLGLIGLLTAPLFFITSAVTANATRNREALGLIFLSMMAFWGISSLLAVVFGGIGMARAARDKGRRRGAGLAVTGLVLGIVGLVGLLSLLFIAALGVIAVAGIDRT